MATAYSDSHRFGVVTPAPYKSPAELKREEAELARKKKAEADKKRQEAAAAKKAAMNKPLSQNLQALLGNALKGKTLRSAD